MKDLIRKILLETVTNKEVICDKCGWSWDISDGGKDKYICHKCGHDNTPKSSNFDRLVNHFIENFPEEQKDKVSEIKNFVKNYIQENNFTIKFLNACPGYSGVRTRDQIIICSPMNMVTIGDFLYTIFHEIRHEQQISEIKMPNPLTDYDLEDFENLYNQYWEMELDADQFAKNMIAKLVIKLSIPIDFAKREFSLSGYIDAYPSMSKSVEMSLRMIIDDIKRIKKSGGEFTDIQDHPMVKNHLKDLEKFI